VSSWTSEQRERDPGPITPGWNCCARWYDESPLYPPLVMRPGFRQDDDGECRARIQSPAASAFFTAFQNASAAFVERLRER